MRTIVLDLETKKLFNEVENGKRSQLEVSVVGIWDSELPENNGFKAYFDNELAKLWPILEAAELIIGFNIKKFDWEVLAPYYPGNIHLLPTLDLIEAVKEGAGFRLKLNDLAQATIGKGKTGTGLDAYRFWKEGNLEALKSYCLSDVAITRDLFLHAKEHGILKYPDLGGVVREFKVDLGPFMPKQNIKSQMSLGV